MIKKLLLIIFVTQNIQAQLSPVQLQKVKADFDKALKAKQFDTAQDYLKQIEQGGRRAYALELSAQLAHARRQDTEAKRLAELHKAHEAEAKRVMATREAEKYKKELEEVKKELKEYKAQQSKAGEVP